METKEKTKAVQELIVINNDRYEGYKTAAKETSDPELKTLFEKHSLQSQKFAEELRTEIPSAETPARDETMASGKLYRVWMDVKAAVTGKDKAAILSSCEFGEKAAKETYDKVIENAPINLLPLIMKQRTELQQSCEKIKSMLSALKLVKEN